MKVGSLRTLKMDRGEVTREQIGGYNREFEGVKEEIIELDQGKRNIYRLSRNKVLD